MPVSEHKKAAAEAKRFAALLSAQGVPTTYTRRPNTTNDFVSFVLESRVGDHLVVMELDEPYAGYRRGNRNRFFIQAFDAEDTPLRDPIKARTIYDAEFAYAQLIARIRGRKKGRVGERDERYQVPLPSTAPRKNPTGPAVTLVALAFRRQPELLRELRDTNGDATVDHAARLLSDWSGKPYTQIREAALNTLATYVRTKVVEPRSFLSWLARRDPRMAIWCMLACVKKLASDFDEGPSSYAEESISRADAWVRDPVNNRTSGLVRVARGQSISTRLNTASGQTAAACDSVSLGREDWVVRRLDEALENVVLAYVGVSRSEKTRKQTLDAIRPQLVEIMADAIATLPEFELRANPAGRTPFIVQRIAADVRERNPRYSLSRAIAIATAQAQRSGYLQPGTRTLTAKGRRKEASYSRAERAKTTAEFERMVVRGNPAVMPIRADNLGKFGLPATPGGRYLTVAGRGDVTGQTYAGGVIDVSGARPRFETSDHAAALPAAKGRRTTKVNLYRRAGRWRWVEGGAPTAQVEGTDVIVSVERGGEHLYALSVVFATPVMLATYPKAKTEPRLRPTARVARVEQSHVVGRIRAAGREHPVYETLTLH